MNRGRPIGATNDEENVGYPITKAKAIEAAKDLGYGPHIIGAIQKAKNSTEASKILSKARHNSMHNDDINRVCNDGLLIDEK